MFLHSFYKCNERMRVVQAHVQAAASFRNAELAVKRDALKIFRNSL